MIERFNTFVIANSFVFLIKHGMKRARNGILPRYFKKETIAICDDDFVGLLQNIFKTACWFGIPANNGFKALTLACIVFFTMLLVEIAAIWKLIAAFAGLADAKGSVIGRLSGTIFYGNALISLILSWKFVLSWEKLSAHWTRIESREGLHLLADRKMKSRITIITALVAVFAVVEHSMSMMSATGFDCPPSEYLQRYILSSHGFMLSSYEYSLWVAVPIFFISKIATILWNFQDLIIILVSIGLTSRYHRLNTYVNHILKGIMQNNPDETLGVEINVEMQRWRRLREAYVRQAELVRRVNGKLGALILLSNLNNLYFICLQLFLGINNEQSSLINKFYYMFSLSWLIIRACSVVLAASDVNVHSRRALPLLCCCPHTAYNIEIKRLKTQLTYDFVALGGMGLFALDRKLLLEVAAAVLKYELILIQYDN